MSQISTSQRILWPANHSLPPPGVSLPPPIHSSQLLWQPPTGCSRDLGLPGCALAPPGTARAWRGCRTGNRSSSLGQHHVLRLPRVPPTPKGPAAPAPRQRCEQEPARHRSPRPCCSMPWCAQPLSLSSYTTRSAVRACRQHPAGPPRQPHASGAVPPPPCPAADSRPAPPQAHHATPHLHPLACRQPGRRRPGRAVKLK